MRLVDFSRLALVAVVSLAGVACGEGFDPQSQIKELRILGIRKDKPYPLPGESVELTMLWHDPARRQLNKQWFPLCINPPGDLYYGCFADPSFLGDGSWLADPDYQREAFTAVVPDDILQGRQAAPGQPRYGLIFSFFTLCAGQLDFVPPTQEGALPIGCRDDEGNLLGSKDFIVGYASMYVFPDPDAPGQFIVNQNPEVLGFQTANGEVSAGTCVNADCIDDPLPEDIDCTNPVNDPICFDACADDGEPTCPEIPIKPLLGSRETVAERDEVSLKYYDRDVGEQMWINYFVDRGGVASDVRLLNDAVTGWNDDFGTDFFAPKEPGPVTIWAIARDNRGGTGWVRTRVGIR